MSRAHNNNNNNNNKLPNNLKNNIFNSSNVNNKRTKRSNNNCNNIINKSKCTNNFTNKNYKCNILLLILLNNTYKNNIINSGNTRTSKNKDKTTLKISRRANVGNRSISKKMYKLKSKAININ